MHPAGLQVVCWDGSSTPNNPCPSPPSWNITSPCSWSFALQFNFISSSALTYTTVFQPNLPQSLPASLAIIHSAFKKSKAKVSPMRELFAPSTFDSCFHRFQCRHCPTNCHSPLPTPARPPLLPLPLPHHQPLPLIHSPGSYFWGIGFASTGSLMVGSLVADREKGTRHQLQMTGLAHKA